jgi:PAS domain S-box-containing protein
MKTILLVEDDWSLASHWHALLEDANYRVIPESTSDGAIDALGSTKIDLVLTDIVLQDDQPDSGGGLAVISYVALSMDEKPAIIAVSGAHGRSNFVDKNFKRLDSLRALQKPISDALLLSTVTELLSPASPTETETAKPLPEDVPDFTKKKPTAGLLIVALVVIWAVLPMFQLPILLRLTLAVCASTALILILKRNAESLLLTSKTGLATEVAKRLETQHQLEEALNSRRAMIRLLGETDGVWDWHVGTDKVEYAPGFRRLFGFDGDDKKGFPNELKSLAERIHVDDREDLWSAQTLGMNAGAPFTHEFRIHRKDGTTSWVRNRATVRLDSNGEAVRMVGSMYAIDNERRIMREQERFFSTAVDLFVVWDLANGRWTRTSPNWPAVLGFSEETLLARTASEKVHPDDLELVTTSIEQLRNGQAIRELVIRFLHKTDGYRLLEWNVDPPDPGESVVFATVRDVTNSTGRIFQTLARIVPEVLYIYDVQNQRTILQNRPLAALVGYTLTAASEFGDAATELVHPDDLPQVLQHFDSVHRGHEGEVFEVDFRLRGADGSWRRIVRRDSVSMTSTDGTVLQYVGTATNLDSLKVLRRYAADLEKANEDLEQFAYIASHDLKQPLRGIDNLAIWVLEDSGEELSEPSRKHLALLRQRVNRLEALLNELLAYSRATRSGGSPVEIDVMELVASTTQLIMPPDTFTVACPKSIDTITGDRAALELVFRNLIGNAIKHHDSESGTIEITSSQDAEGLVTFSVSDDGPGIEQQFHEKIFAMFKTLKPRDEVEGSGMGLAIVKRIIETNGGTIRVESTVGEGSTFHFTWPNRAAAMSTTS